MRMAGDPDFMFLGNRNDALQKISDPLPKCVFADQSGFRKRRLLPRFVVYERTVLRAASARRRFGAHHAQNTQVVLERRHSSLGRIPDHLAYAIDLAVTLRALA